MPVHIYVSISGTEKCLASSQGIDAKAAHCEVQTTVCDAASYCSLSIVNTACVVYGNVGHLFVVLFGVGPQVEVDDDGVDVAGLPASLLY